MEQLTTQRLVIRRFTADDWQDLYDYLSKPEVVKYEPYEPMTLEECKEQAVWRAGQESFWAVCLKDTGKVIGNLYFQRQEPEHWRTWELGYVFNDDFWGHGYATEAAQALVEYAFTHWRMHRLIAMCNPDNAASWKLMERLGMRRECHKLLATSFKDDENGEPIWHDGYEYAILDTEWKH
ncbi:MAG: GNAT family N-acetyltransferase [Eubacteriales bacterium]|nr:GNAT family N-acetyltransferase [Eubacteriales bacterium]